MKKILFISGLLLIMASLYFALSTKALNTKEGLIKQQENPKTPDPTTFTCPEETWVDCMPTIYDPNNPKSVKGNNAREFRCSETYLKWAKENCPNFEGAAY